MNICSILGHKGVWKKSPNIIPKDRISTVLDHCDRCGFINGAWVCYTEHWVYFKR